MHFILLHLFCQLIIFCYEIFNKNVVIKFSARDVSHQQRSKQKHLYDKIDLVYLSLS